MMIIKIINQFKGPKMMYRLVQRVGYQVRKLKNVEPQSWVQKPQDASVKFADADLSHLNIRYNKDVKYEINAQKKAGTLPQQQPPRPISPVMGPITVENPKIHDKIYRWCSCGMSTKQPFCDGSHQGTAFKPYKFTVEQKAPFIKLCGCKLTTNKPFCDGESCKCAPGNQ